MQLFYYSVLWITELKRKLKRNVKTGLVLAFIAGLLALFIRPDYRQGEASLRGRAAKNFQFTIDGQHETLTDLRGKVVVLNFWATWCQPCVEETPSLLRLQKRLASRGATILGISLDDDPSAYADFLKTYHIDYPTYRDATKKSALDYGTVMYPETYIIDRNGRIDRKIIGAQDWQNPQMSAYLDSLLDAKN